MIYNIALIPAYIAIIFAIYHEIKLKHKVGTILMILMSILFIGRFMLIGYQFAGNQLSGTLELLNDFTLLFLIPFVYMYLCDQCGTRWYNGAAITMILCILIIFIPSPSFEVSGTSGIQQYDVTYPRSINIYRSGHNIFHLPLKNIVSIIHCIIIAWRMYVLYKRVRSYGLKFSKHLKNYFVWMAVFLAMVINAHAHSEYISSSQLVHWIFFISFSLVTTWGFAMVPSSFSVSPIVTEDDEKPVRLDSFIENNVHLVERLHQLMEEEKIYLRQGIVIDDAAQLVGTNRTYFTRLMREEYGQTFNDYVSNARIGYSKQLLLKGSMSLEEIAQKSGFPNASSYCRTFKRITDLTPTQWKKGE